MSLIDTLKSVFSEPFPYPAMANELLESAGMDAKALAKDFVENCVSLANRNDKSGSRIPLLEWLADIVQTQGGYTIAFFGRSVYGGAGCKTSDVEAVMFIPEDLSTIAYFIGSTPEQATLLKVFESKSVVPHFQEHDLSYLFTGPVLLYPSVPHPFAIERIDSARKVYGKNEEYGLMERIPHAASKILNTQEMDLFDSPEIASRFRAKNLPLTDAFQNLDFGERPCISDVNMAYERGLMKFPEEDLSTLVKAALRRIRVKEEHRERLAVKYIERLKRRR